MELMNMWAALLLGLVPVLGGCYGGRMTSGSSGHLSGGAMLHPCHMGVSFFQRNTEVSLVTDLVYMNMYHLFCHLIIMCGDGEGMYRSHIFGSPTIIACSPVIIKHQLHTRMADGKNRGNHFYVL
ncbi:hypothetical protein RJ640_015181 [Escallonia rubra]|uniref:Secreted protein n=1 Tax=Escallonia rubra TaxID=112253 RepID=A0AA88UWD6_9ASTE|nr:hypothetical protein RJ640_015181 [Escallonia rubra]